MWVLWRLGYQWQLPPPSSPVAPGRKCWWGDVFKDLLKGINAFIRQPSPDHGTVLSQPLCQLHTRRGTMHLRRQDGNNVPMMSNYLSYYFSDIPVNMHMPIIVATFTAAQKVAATMVTLFSPEMMREQPGREDRWHAGHTVCRASKKVPLRHRIKWPCVQWCYAGLPIETAWRTRRRSVQWVYGTGTVLWEERWSQQINFVTSYILFFHCITLLTVDKFTFQCFVHVMTYHNLRWYDNMQVNVPYDN